MSWAHSHFDVRQCANADLKRADDAQHLTGTLVRLALRGQCSPGAPVLIGGPAWALPGGPVRVARRTRRTPGSLVSNSGHTQRSPGRPVSAPARAIDDDRGPVRAARDRRTWEVFGDGTSRGGGHREAWAPAVRALRLPVPLALAWLESPRVCRHCAPPASRKR